jgi:DNA topoisomerase VI subunit B
MAQVLQRETFEINRALEFFTERELSMQIGCAKNWWPMALLKELIDNALDACEGAGIAPRVSVTVEPDSVSVSDNGPGLPVATLERSLDYMVRVSDKTFYVSPTRGQLGNALKCVWAAPFVAGGGTHGQVEVHTNGTAYTVDVSLDRIAQAPHIELTRAGGVVKSGTLVKIHWPGYLAPDSWGSFYNRPPSALALVQAYAAFNPHSAFVYWDGEEGVPFESTPTDPSWRKWGAAEPTSPHWYNAERLRALIAAYVGKERNGNGGNARTVRAFVSEFRGLSASAKQKEIAELAGLSGAYLHDLVRGDDVDAGAVSTLLTTMQWASRPVKPAALGAIGEAHMKAWFEARHRVEPQSIQYRQVCGEAGGLPFILEVAFGIYTEEYAGCGRELTIGLNWAPVLQVPVHELSELMGEAQVNQRDPVAMALHIACPRLEFTDRGKSRLALPPEIGAALAKAVRLVTAEYTKEKRQADRAGRLRESQLERLRRDYRPRAWNIREAAFHVMREAYLKASANGTLPANARQVMYAARPLVLDLTGGKCWKNSSYFTQTLLPDYVDRYQEKTSAWDVVYDARGKLIEPHTGERADLGTVAVREYIGRWSAILSEHIPQFFNKGVETVGPGLRFNFALFVEKEGFNELWEAVRLAERYDMAIMSTKGMSVTAARTLVEKLSDHGVTVLVLHDFDKSGLSIVNTLRTNTRRYSYGAPPRVVDLGLRLEDVRAMNLQSEPVEYDSKKDPKINLRESGATEEECAFLVSGGRGQWRGARVELNAMTSDQVVKWVEAKLDAAGVCKVVPGEEDLARAYRRATRIMAVEQAIAEALADIDGESAPVPEGLADRVREYITGTAIPWDDAIAALARKEQQIAAMPLPDMAEIF